MTLAPPPRLIVFDLYGTLLDLASVLASSAAALGGDGPSLLAEWRARQLAHTWLRTLMGRYAPFDQVTAESLDAVLSGRPYADEALRARLLDAFRAPAPYPEAAALLADLATTGIPCAILSNGTPDMIASALGAGGLHERFRWVLSVDAVRQYKPAPAAYRLVGERTGVAPGEALFVSANWWDAAGASAFGFPTAWVNRDGAAADPLGAPSAHAVTSLDGLRPLLGLPARSAS